MFEKNKKHKGIGLTKHKKRLYIIILLFVAFFPFFSACKEIVYAANGLKTHVQSEHGGWAPNGLTGDDSHGSIYDRPSFTDVLADKITDIETIKENLGELVIEGDMNNYIFNLFTCVIGTIAYSIGKALQSFGIGICNIIYGRVLGFGAVDASGVLVMQPLSGNYTETTFFHFELVEGNIYGYIGAIMYAGFRILGVVGIVCVCLTKLAVSMVKPSGEARESLKSTISSSCIMLAALFLMPYLLDLAIYVRNVLLYGIGMFCFEQFGTYNLLDAFLGAYGDTGNLNVWVLDLGMLGMVIITLYFAFQYMSVAMGTMLMFIIFPVVCLVSSYDRNTIRSWIREMIGYLMVPVIDALLLVVPLIIGHVAETQIILQVVSMGMIIPARQAVRSMLGMSSSSGIDRVGAFGAMAAVAMAKTIAGTVAKVVGTFASGGVAQVASKAGGAMAGAKKEALTSAQDQMSGVNGFGGSPVTRLPFDMDEGVRAKNQPRLDEYNKLLSSGKVSEAARFRKDNLAEVENYLKPKSSAKDRESDMREGSARVDALTGSDNLGIGANKERISALQEENRGYVDKISKLNLDNAHIASAIEAGYKDKSEGRQEIADNKVFIAEHEQALKENMGKINALQEENRSYEDSVRGYKNFYGKDGIPEDKKNDIEMRFANAMNFDSGMFKSLTEAQKAEFYAERAVAERQRAKGMAFGMAGGAVLGYGGTMFMDNSTKVGAITLGSSAGGALGGMLAERFAPISNKMSVNESYSGGGSVININNATTGQGVDTSALALYNERQLGNLLKEVPVDAKKYEDVFRGILSRQSFDDIRSCPQVDMDRMCSQLSRELRAELSVVTDCVNRMRKASV